MDDISDEGEQEVLCRIVGVSELDTTEGSLRSRLMFRFVNNSINDEDICASDFEYGACSIMMNCNWVRWEQNTSK